MGTDSIVSGLRGINRAVGYLVGILLLVTAGYILAEIVLRMTGGVLGGSDEYSGYMTAVVASWGFAYALTEQAHVRIDLVQRTLPNPMQAFMDCLALLATAAVALLVVYFSWDVLSKTISGGAKANTPLETPLWIPQTLWFAGWVWFAVNAFVLTLVSAAMLMGGRFDAVGQNFGARGEEEQ